ncbi:MAG: TIGR03915 family putative DNA repair protein [Verrucomicrobiota bacterium]|nr:TIGR03915 family putative DNA repair protein [Verrucomicrobiota bacterium]
MKIFRIDPTFQSWRGAARMAISNELPPGDCIFVERGEASLFEADTFAEEKTAKEIRVPKEFKPLAEAVACHVDTAKWQLLYMLLWRLNHGEPKLLEISSDPVVRRAHELQKQVGRSIHKMTAFVRFREFQREGDEKSHFFAWYEPEHFILNRVAPFFRDRFYSMNWSILTPIGCIHWNLKDLSWSEPVSKPLNLEPDSKEELWLAYYRSTFNPARLKLKAMTAEMPKKYWKNLPEAGTISELIQNALPRVERMLNRAAVEGVDKM